MVKMTSKWGALPGCLKAVVYQAPPQAANSSSSFLMSVTGEATPPSIRMTLLQ